MEDTSKYLIRANVTADGVVERSDVVGAIFGQTEGLLGDELDLRELRQSGKVGHIDVEITSTRGTSQGHLTIATSLDKVETATLAASLETITRVGPCRANLEVGDIEDVRAAKRKDVVERAKELLRTGFDDSVMSSDEILEEVREYVRVADITEFEGLPAGPRVGDSDAIIVVEGRSDVLTMLKYGVKNAIAVEGTNVPDAVAELTHHRTVTVFLDGDRGGDLIFEELSQVGDIDYVTFAPAGTSVEDLDHTQLFTALRNKVPFETVSGANEPRDAIAATDGSQTPAPPASTESPADGPVQPDSSLGPEADSDSDSDSNSPSLEGGVDDGSTVDSGTESAPKSGATSTDSREPRPRTVYDHATEVIRNGTERVRFLDVDGEILEEGEASDAQAMLEAADPDSVSTVLFDGLVSQQLLDVAADAGVDRLVGRLLGQFTKRPTSVRVYAIDDIAESAP